MSDFRSLFKEGNARGIAKLVGLGGFLLALLAFALVVNFWNAKRTYTKIQATITDVGQTNDKTSWSLTYEYQWGTKKVTDSTSFPEKLSSSYHVGGTILLLEDPETGEITFADNEDFIRALSLKLGVVGVVLMLGASIFMWMNPKPG